LTKSWQATLNSNLTPGVLDLEFWITGLKTGIGQFFGKWIYIQHSTAVGAGFTPVDKPQRGQGR
jgi:hypothetical protein